MTVARIRLVESEILRSQQRFDAEAGQRLVKAARDWLSITAAERDELFDLLARNHDRMGQDAARVVLDALGVERVGGLQNLDVVRWLPGRDSSKFEDDLLYLGRDGKVSGAQDLKPFTRSWGAVKQGPTRVRHGSVAPASTVLSDADRQATQDRAPGAALDAMAQRFGRSTGFERMANSPAFYDPKAEFWVGKCHAWAWAALSEVINRAVDVEGVDGAKGIWLAGEWLSRADLGNWMMGVADRISVNHPVELFDSRLTALDLLKGSVHYLIGSGGGVIADIYNDQKHGKKEVWNQPFVNATLQTTTLDGAPAAAVLALTHARGAATVKHVNLVASYANEVSDQHEGGPNLVSRTWNLYAVTDLRGKVLTAYMADDDALAEVADLPTRTTDEVPEYWWKPKLDAVDDVLAGKPNRLVELDRYGKEFTFFVGTVLKLGVPAATREAFEEQLATLGEGALSAGDVDGLAQAFPTVANAYSPEQWAQSFGARGLRPQAFGAAWDAAAQAPKVA